MFVYATKEDSIQPFNNKYNKISNNENPICTLRYFINIKVTFQAAKIQTLQKNKNAESYSKQCRFYKIVYCIADFYEIVCNVDF